MLHQTLIQAVVVWNVHDILTRGGDWLGQSVEAPRPPSEFLVHPALEGPTSGPQEAEADGASEGGGNTDVRFDPVTNEQEVMRNNYHI